RRPAAHARADVARQPGPAVGVLGALHAAAFDARHQHAAHLRGRLLRAAGLAHAAARVAHFAERAGRAGEAAQVLLAHERPLVAALARVAVAAGAADDDVALHAALGARMVGAQ